MRNYNYVFFNAIDGSKLKKNTDGYYTICVKDLEDQDDIELVPFPLYYKSLFARILFNIHHAKKINDKIDLPFKSLWYPYYFKNKFKEKRPLCFVVLNAYLTSDYFRYLKKRFPDCKIVCVHRDLLKIYKDKYPDFVLNPLFDLEMSFDKGECEKFGMTHFDEFESETDVQPTKDRPVSDVFFAGKAKDRSALLLKVYDRLSEHGLKCRFMLTNTPEKERVYRDGITYLEKAMSYREYLSHAVNSRCILEINQSGAVGYTSRFLEAVMFNKKLITNNAAVKDSCFYNEDYIQYFENASDISVDFVLRDVGEVDYGYNGEFSPLRLLDLIDEKISKKA